MATLKQLRAWFFAASSCTFVRASMINESVSLNDLEMLKVVLHVISKLSFEAITLEIERLSAWAVQFDLIGISEAMAFHKFGDPSYYQIAEGYPGPDDLEMAPLWSLPFGAFADEADAFEHIETMCNPHLEYTIIPRYTKF